MAWIFCTMARVAIARTLNSRCFRANSLAGHAACKSNAAAATRASSCKPRNLRSSASMVQISRRHWKMSLAWAAVTSRGGGVVGAAAMYQLQARADSGGPGHALAVQVVENKHFRNTFFRVKCIKKKKRRNTYICAFSLPLGLYI